MLREHGKQRALASQLPTHQLTDLSVSTISLEGVILFSLLSYPSLSAACPHLDFCVTAPILSWSGFHLHPTLTNCEHP